MSDHRDLVQEIGAELRACQTEPDAAEWRVHVDPALPNVSAFVARMQTAGARAYLDDGPVAVVFSRELEVTVARAMAPTQTPQSICPFRSRIG